MSKIGKFEIEEKGPRNRISILSKYKYYILLVVIIISLTVAIVVVSTLPKKETNESAKTSISSEPTTTKSEIGSKTTYESSSYPTSTIFNDQSIDETISKMSIEDKCGQMTQITIDTITKCPPGCDSFTSDGTPSACSCPLIDDTNPLNLTKLEEAIQKYRVGSILNTAYDRAQKASIWQDIINQIQKTASDTELKIPILYGLDSIHGANYIQEATLFPQPLAMAASFNIDIAKRVGAITAMETRAVGVPWNFNPVLDIGRQHLWPR